MCDRRGLFDGYDIVLKFGDILGRIYALYDGWMIGWMMAHALYDLHFCTICRRDLVHCFTCGVFSWI